MALKEYHRKRDFQTTPEPKGATNRGGGNSFVVQMHAARRLHYDLRLEHNGVLVSWAVPKGPSLDPAEKRLAVQVEDHPLDYGDFEGTIPQGEYGGGSVMVWDRGTWAPLEDAEQGLKEGKLKFFLDGEKLRGAWMLVRIKSRERSPKPNWLLIKERDDEARPLAEGDVLAQAESAKTGRSLAEIAAGKPPHKRNKTVSKVKKIAKAPKRLSPAKVAGAEKAPMPKLLDAQLASLAGKVPLGDEWLHEMKFDGYRMFCRIENGRATFFSRNHQDWTARMGSLPKAAAELPVKTAVLDGEVVALDERGVSDFERLQKSFKSISKSLVYYVFDLLYLDGVSLAGAPLEARKHALEMLLKNGNGVSIRFSEHVIGSGPEFLQQACQSGLEGIISKRRDARYSPGRGASWLKSKCRQGQELVIGGFTEPQGSRTGIGALMLGFYRPDGKLAYAGRVGTGFDHKTLGDLRMRLERLEQKSMPFDHVERSERKGAHWVRPELVANIEFANWTSDGHVRQAVYHGLREDKPASEVVREKRSPNEENKALKKGADKAPGLDGLNVRLTHPERVLFPETGLTKRGLANYYVSVAEWMLPHVVGRPLALLRCPDGRTGSCFFQKHPMQGLSKAVRRVAVQTKSETSEHLVVDDLEGVLSLVQFGALEMHVWGARVDAADHPDRIVFDLDPDESLAWERVVEAAELLHELFHEFGWETFLKTTGGKGLHVVAPIARKHEWPEVKAFSKAIADLLSTAAPDRFTSTVAKAARRGKIFIDYLRNDLGSTSVAALSSRAREGAPVSMPISWSELAALDGPGGFTVENAFEHLSSRRKVPWEEISSVRQSITAKVKKRLGLS